VITPSSLHYIATTRGAFLPEIDPQAAHGDGHGTVDRALTFTMDDLKRLPSVTRLHFVECAGNRHNGRHKNVQESHGMTSCAEWTGVLLSTLLKEAGLKGSAAWFIAEGAEEIKGASSMPIAKAMDDALLAYGMNGEPVRPQQGFPLRLVVPGFEGIFNTKWVRRIKVTDRYFMNYNDYGHLDEHSTKLRSACRSDPSRSSRTRPAHSSCPARASTKSADWPGPAEVPSSSWRSPPTAGRRGTAPSSRASHNVEQGGPGGHSTRRTESAEGQDADWRSLRPATRLEARDEKA